MPLLFVSIQPVLDRKIPLDTEKPRTAGRFYRP